MADSSLDDDADVLSIADRREVPEMFVAIYHEIHDQEQFKQKVNAMAPPPAELRRHQFLTSTDLSRAACLWEAPSVGAVRDYIDGSLVPERACLTAGEGSA